ncbi:tripartite tricarboxylate transporter substrate binding protein [Ramlibacter sp. AW1]|uniref:Tripartite tricarboxylate transporter substrate binding protein n=1 Tax=Ramlibacter aurantiacus TaxID=2801330 RepID=A0A936ZTH4_9BURK|nr:tripartite tricarboxylate transporter substrate binding protein [Ramlibacter aurantiacus]MBL0423421.1 tripartite tricarboxylate transporter substrate binding protein [Ramlibacter aurantiacus]
MNLVVGTAAGLALPVHGQAEQFPRGPLRIVIPLGAGGAADVVTRPLGMELEKSLKQSVIVDNRPGGLFVIGLQSALSAPADGHTLFYLYNSVVSVQAAHKQYDILQQLTPVSQLMTMPMVLMVPGNSPFRTVADLVEFGRKNPGKLNYASLGPASTEHLKALQLQKAGGFQAAHVPYKSGPEMIKALVAGEVDFEFNGMPFAMSFAPKGLARVLAVMEPQRATELPSVPSITETGFDVGPLSYWGGYAVHAATPRPVVERLHSEIAAAVRTPLLHERYAPLGAAPKASASPAAFSHLIAQELAWAQEMTKGLNLAGK